MKRRELLTIGAIAVCIAAGEALAITEADLLRDLAEPAAGPSAAVKEVRPLEAASGAPEASAARLPDAPLLAGKVAETMDAGGYTYILLEKDGRKKWVAIPEAKVAVGQEVQVAPGMEMGRFTSKSLGRSFDDILFSVGLVADTEQKKPDGHMQMPPGHPGGEVQAMPKGMSAMLAAGGGAQDAAALAGKVVETMDGGGYTYLCLEKEGGKTWAAVPPMKVAVGDVIELQPGNVMTNFTSKSLNRTFERVVFSAGPAPKKQEQR
ncbi:hypothetical protein [Geobacter sp. SVR]|uniref:hypothetical protein n=1 Tax=Geobacter sp. SVR TaxID=2495594 RepID=UPI00143F0376|nr:hypothetical protein [Geobacter sp. SVR]BCS53258.1 hypothetical protein GSVR_15660 [Geobacter sp. SVR]GCF84644.1 hypothetical protein GSbR_12440 [Geobacter sp. SVR]